MAKDGGRLGTLITRMTSGGHREGGEGGGGRGRGRGLQSNNGLHFIVERSTTKDRVPKWLVSKIPTLSPGGGGGAYH